MYQSICSKYGVLPLTLAVVGVPALAFGLRQPMFAAFYLVLFSAAVLWVDQWFVVWLQRHCYGLTVASKILRRVQVAVWVLSFSVSVVAAGAARADFFSR